MFLGFWAAGIDSNGIKIGDFVLKAKADTAERGPYMAAGHAGATVRWQGKTAITDTMDKGGG